MDKNIKRYIMVMILIVIFIPTVSRALEVKTYNLPSEMIENSDMSFDIDIGDYNYANYISIETDIVKKGNEPIFDFGQLNEKYVGIDRYKQQIMLDIPKDVNNFKVKITGRSPNGIETSKVGNIEIAKFIDENQKYYEIRLLGKNKEDLGQKNKESKLFRLIVNERVSFEKELNNIKSDDLDDLKDIAENMFNRGLVIDAKKLVSALENIRTPENQILPYKEYWKDILLAIVVFFIFIIGYMLGQRGNYE